VPATRPFGADDSILQRPPNNGGGFESGKAKPTEPADNAFCWLSARTDCLQIEQIDLAEQKRSAPKG
jgi:hypothetical protein